MRILTSRCAFCTLGLKPPIEFADILTRNLRQAHKNGNFMFLISAFQWNLALYALELDEAKAGQFIERIHIRNTM